MYSQFLTPHGLPQPRQIKSLFSLPEPHQEDLGFSQLHSGSKSLDSVWGNHSDVTFIHFQGNGTKTKNKLSREPNHNTGYITSDNLIYKRLVSLVCWVILNFTITSSNLICRLQVWQDPSHLSTCQASWRGKAMPEDKRKTNGKILTWYNRTDFEFKVQRVLHILNFCDPLTRQVGLFYCVWRQGHPIKWLFYSARKEGLDQQNQHIHYSAW